MRELPPVLRIFGGLLVLFSLLLALPMAGSLWAREDMWSTYLLCMAVGCAAGTALVWRLRRADMELQPRHGILLVVCVWVLLPLFACLPILLVMRESGYPLSFSAAYFEGVSGLTTSGSSVLNELSEMPFSLNLWCTFLQWLGGMGILILAVAILPMLDVGGSQAFRAEVAGPVKDTKLTPRITQTAKGLWSVYLFMSLACFCAFLAAGMPFADALMHMFTTVSLGGLSPHHQSFGFFHSPLLEAIAMVFMVLASCNFAVYFSAARSRRPALFFKELEVRATIVCLLAGGLIVSAYLWLKGAYSVPDALRYGMFNTISMASTTGFVTADYLQWPTFAPVFLLLLSCVCCSAGSTGGGIKMLRVLVVLQQARHELIRLAHPRVLSPVRLRRRVVDEQVIFSVLTFLFFYLFVLLLLSLALLVSGLDLVTSFSAILASLNCAGPGLGLVGPASSYAALSDFQLNICSLAMLLGRLEILSIMVLLTPDFWRS